MCPNRMTRFPPTVCRSGLVLSTSFASRGIAGPGGIFGQGFELRDRSGVRLRLCPTLGKKTGCESEGQER